MAARDHLEDFWEEVQVECVRRGIEVGSPKRGTELSVRAATGVAWTIHHRSDHLRPGIIEELRHESEEPTIDELWELADGDGVGTKPAAEGKPAEPSEAPPPEKQPEPEAPEPAEEDAEPNIADIKNPEDPISWLRMAGELAAAGRKEEAEMCRKTAMSLLEENR